jgi:hypothetical protein
MCAGEVKSGEKQFLQRGGPYGLHIDESWSVEQLEIFKLLVLEACEALQTRETIPSAEIETWPMIDDLRKRTSKRP